MRLLSACVVAAAARAALDTANSSNCTLARFPPSLSDRVHFFSFVAADLFHMLAHALRYYRHLGVDFRERSRFVVHNASGAEALRKTTTYLDRYGAPYAVRGDWSSALKRDLANAYLATLPWDALLVYPDLDEFFAYPCDLEGLVLRKLAIAGDMADRVAFDWRLARLKALPATRLVTNASLIASQFPRSCSLTAGLFGTNAHKFTLVPAADAEGNRLQYVNAHSVECRPPEDPIDRRRRRLKSKNRQRASGCVGIAIHRGPPVAHYGFTRVTVPMLERKLATYRAIYAEKKNVASLDAVRHYERLRENFAWCPTTNSYQFTAPARHRAEAVYCDPLPGAVAANYPAPVYCPEPPTAAPGAPARQPTRPPAPAPRARPAPT